MAVTVYFETPSTQSLRMN